MEVEAAEMEVVRDLYIFMLPDPLLMHCLESS